MNLEILLYIFVFLAWVIYGLNSSYQNKRLKHFAVKSYVQKNIKQFLSFPFKILYIISIFIIIEKFLKIPLGKTIIQYTLLSYIEIGLGALFLAISAILYTYLTFFEKSFPSCLAIKNNQELEGIYKYIRHPSFYIFFFITFGTALCLQNTIIFILAIVNHIAIYIYYMIEENQMKKTNPFYAMYLKKTNRFFPTFINKKADAQVPSH